MKLITIIGARPQFIKAAVTSRAIKEYRPDVSEIVIHTGQHFDVNMSDVFFEQLEIPRPDYCLNINGGTHGEMTGRMLIEIERILLIEKPDRVMVYGDTNSTLAGALAASKLQFPVAHVEAGLRSFNMQMPEEINRILTDQVSDLLFCPTDVAVQNLSREGFFEKSVSVLQVGDVMQDAAYFFSGMTADREVKGVKENEFILATLHRAENTDNIDRLKSIVIGLNELHRTVAPVVLPLHPRTKAAIQSAGLTLEVKLIDPVGYLEMIVLLRHCSLVLTDSGGVQKEAFFFGKPCITMRDETEWVELLTIGANVLVGADADAIVKSAKDSIGINIVDRGELYGGGKAAQKIAEKL